MAELAIEVQTVNVGLLYNPFDISRIENHQLVYENGKTIAEYIEGLPDSCDWKIGLNGVPIAPENYTEICPAPNDNISVVMIPRGGGGGKDILRLVALVALVAVAAIVLGPGAFGIPGVIGLTGTSFAIAFAATVAVGSFLINMAIPPTVPKIGGSLGVDDGQSYGYDGAKNTAHEGVTMPVVYGAFNVAGNYVDMFTQNIGDDQYLYGRVVLSDGEIDSLNGKPTLNELPIGDYQHVEWGWTKGLVTELANTRFNRAIAQYARQAELTPEDGWVQYTTVDEIDAFQLNFVFPRGLIGYNDDGSHASEESVLEIQYAPYGTTSWNAPGIPSTGGDGGISGGYEGGGGVVGGGGGYTGVHIF